MKNYNASNSTCIFCNNDDAIMTSELCYARFDGFPVSNGHVLIIPNRHVDSAFNLTTDEVADMYHLANEVKKMLDDKYHPNGYNIGFNVGAAAGQTIMHVHMHIIPRYTGDVENPRGGVRGVIPSKQNY